MISIASRSAPDGQIGPPAHVEAAAQLSENHGPAVARRLADAGEGGENNRLAAVLPVRHLWFFSFVCEDNELVPRLSGCGQVATLLADACRLPVMPFSFIPLPPLVVDPAELMPCGRLHLGLVKLLQESQRRLLTRPRLLEVAFRQRERAEPPQVYTLTPEVVQFLGNLEGRFVCLPRVAVVATGAKRIAEDPNAACPASP